MHKKNFHSQGKAYEVIQNNIRSLLARLEHRAEILMAISRNQQTNGYHELAEASKHQAMETKRHAEIISKLLMGET